jgi:hypothetical protein
METSVHALEMLPAETPDSEHLMASNCTPSCQQSITQITTTHTSL